MLVAFIWALCVARADQPDSIREGHEVVSWTEMKQDSKKKVLALKYIMTAAISLYLPISKAIVQIWYCDAQLVSSLNDILGGSAADACPVSDYDMDSATGLREHAQCICGEWSMYSAAKYVGIVFFLGYTLLLPYYCYTLIQKNKPVGSRDDPNKRYNDDGDLVDYTDAMYLRDCNTSPDQLANPWLFLYKGYERRWAFYKVIIMMFKFLLILPAILLWNDPIYQGVAALLLLCTLFGLSVYSTPFINPEADWMDMSGRVAAALTVLFGVISAKATSSSGAMGALINVVNALNFIILLVLVLYALPPVRSWVKAKLGRLSFSDTTLEKKGTFDQIMPYWEVDKEIKHRIWFPFWDTLMLQDPTITAETQARFRELKHITHTVGRRRIEGHFHALALPGMSALQSWCAMHLEGVDVFWPGNTHDGTNDSSTKFGKMYIQPYPWCAVIVLDDSDDYHYIYSSSPEFIELIRVNCQPEVLRRRCIRKMFRALRGRRIHHTFTKTVHKMVPDGVYQENGQDKQRMTSIPVQMTFTSGVVNVKANTKKRMAAGFKVSITFDDGRGSGRAPHTGQMHHFTNEVYTMGANEMGVNSTYTWQPPMSTILSNPGNQAQVLEGLPDVFHHEFDYRRELVEKRIHDEEVLSHGFWLYVYDAFAAPRPLIEGYLRNYETNPNIRTLPDPDRHARGLDYLYGRLQAVCRHPAAAYWWVFWDDLWAQNHDLKQFKEFKSLLDPRLPNSIAYKPCTRDQLEDALALSKVRYSTKFISDAMLDALYEEMDRRCASTNPLARTGMMA
jgi:hypothetical protein